MSSHGTPAHFLGGARWSLWLLWEHLLPLGDGGGWWLGRAWLEERIWGFGGRKAYLCWRDRGWRQEPPWFVWAEREAPAGMRLLRVEPWWLPRTHGSPRSSQRTSLMVPVTT